MFCIPVPGYVRGSSLIQSFFSQLLFCPNGLDLYNWSGFPVFLAQFFLFPPRGFAVGTCTSRQQLSKISKGCGESKICRISSRTVEVCDVLEADHMLAPKRA
jgi:hypothetical protein